MPLLTLPLGLTILLTNTELINPRHDNQQDCIHDSVKKINKLILPMILVLNCQVFRHHVGNRPCRFANSQISDINLTNFKPLTVYE